MDGVHHCGHTPGMISIYGPQWLVPGAGKGLAAGPGPFIFHGLRGVAQQPDHVQC